LSLEFSTQLEALNPNPLSRQLVDVGLKRAQLEAILEKSRLNQVKAEAQKLDIGIWIPESSSSGHNFPAVDDAEAPESSQVMALATFFQGPSSLSLPLCGCISGLVQESCVL
jgi:hypothetical protein